MLLKKKDISISENSNGVFFYLNRIDDSVILIIIKLTNKYYSDSSDSNSSGSDRIY